MSQPNTKSEIWDHAEEFWNHERLEEKYIILNSLGFSLELAEKIFVVLPQTIRNEIVEYINGY